MNGTRLLVPLVLLGLCSKAQLVKIPMEYSGKHIFIKVSAGKSDSLRFVFDTGATNASIDSIAAEKAGISQENRQVIEAAGHGGAQNYVMAMNQSFKIGGLVLDGVNPLLVDFSNMTKATGMKLDGLIGYELLNKYVTGIDFETKEMSFYTGIKEVDTTGYTGIPFEFSKGILIPRFPVSIRLVTGEVLTGKVMFDSGGFFTLLVSTPFNKFYMLSEKLPNRTLKQSRGMSAVTTEERAMIRSMSFNGFELGEMPIDLTVNDQAEPKDGYLGMIGIEIIGRFNLIIDYPNEKIYMKPNKAYRGEFKMDLEMRVKDLTPDSRAFLAANAKKAGVKLTPSGLQYRVVKAGKGPKPSATDKVTIYYSMTLADGKKIWKGFDKSTPWIHHIDKALAGMQEALVMMPVGSKWTLYMPAELAFGLEGYEDVPPGAAVICELELVNIVKK